MHNVFWDVNGVLDQSNFELLRGELKKSGLASEAITRVLRQLEQNGQVLRNPYNICKILVYSSFGYVEN